MKHAYTKPRGIISRNATNGRNLLDLHSNPEESDFVKQSKFFRGISRITRLFYKSNTPYRRPQKPEEAK